MKLLVTGGAGFIGSNFIRYVLKNHEECEIINLDKLTYAGNKENLTDVEGDSRYLFVQGDICDVAIVDELVSSVDAIVHFAAESHVDRSIDSAMEFVQTNVIGTLVLLDAAVRHGGKRFHHISTDEVFGSLGVEGVFDETTPYEPRSPYSASKAGSDHLVRAYWHTHKLPVTITNCSNNYGPYQHPEKIIPLFITNLLEGKKVPVYGTGKNVRDWLYVIDHCRAIDLVLRKGVFGETYCVGGGTELTNIELTRRLLQLMGEQEDMIEFVEDRKGHDFRYAIDSRKVRSLGWEPGEDFDENLKATIEWYKRNENWWRPLKSS